MKNFYKTFKNRVRKPGYWVIVTTRVIIGIFVTVIAGYILSFL
jgi:hypothetical protein